jgi:hypothetical protein
MKKRERKIYKFDHACKAPFYLFILTPKKEFLSILIDHPGDIFHVDSTVFLQENERKKKFSSPLNSTDKNIKTYDVE